MSDYLITNQEVDEKEINNFFAKNYLNKQIHKLKGEWGQIFFNSNHYNGFDYIENSNFIFIVLGGPVLTFDENNFLKNEAPNNFGTQELLKRYLSNELVWDKDLDGPFNIVIINKKSNVVSIITDVMSFIPSYQYYENSTFAISSHIDLLAASIKLKNVDEASVVDFVVNGYITYPYTFYTQIKQMSPGSVHSFSKNRHNSNYYWLPKEENMYKSKKKAADEIRKDLQNYVDSITKHLKDTAHFISGGEDSRTISALFNQKIKKDSFIFLDYLNREGKIAKKVANVYGSNFHLIERNKYYYLDILSESNQLVGSGSQYFHAHALKLYKQANLDSYSAVFGGLYSDAFLKGARIKKIKGGGQLPFIPQVAESNKSIDKRINNPLFPQEIMDTVNERHENHINLVKELRPNSYMEWFELWPITMNMNSPNLHCNRRLFRSYEPFTSTPVVKAAAKTPQKWKLNRILFREIAKPYLKKSRFLTHSDGRLPYYPWYINTLFVFKQRFMNAFKQKIGINITNQGPFADWDTIKKSNYYKDFWIENEKYFSFISSFVNKPNLLELQKTKDLTMIQKLNLLQAIDSLKKIDKLKK